MTVHCLDDAPSRSVRPAMESRWKMATAPKPQHPKLQSPKLRPKDCAGPQADEAGSDIIDLGHLRRFTLGDQALELEILGLFIDQVPLTLQALNEARSGRDWMTAAHTLKGSARAVGAWRIADIAEHAERSVEPSDRAACEAVLKELAAAAGEARDRILALGHCG
jgi:HPt (histidine-containing phosphotransfer) domain-containing protein